MAGLYRRAEAGVHTWRNYFRLIGIGNLRVQDARRTCAKLCWENGGNLEQIKFLLGRSSIQTAERNLGAGQRSATAVNDNLCL